LGGTNADFANAIAVQGSNTIVVVGETLSPSLAGYGGTTTLAGLRDGFVVRLFDNTGTNAIPQIFTVEPWSTNLRKLTLAADGYATSSLSIEGAADLGPGAWWEVISSASFVPQGPGRFEVYLPDTDAVRFYRVKTN
jgi:hypothetical protein